jgi:hypothetical protein
MADRKGDPLNYRKYELRAGLWLMRRRELDLVAKLVYFALDYQYDWGKEHADPTEAILAYMLSITEREVRRALGQLRRLDLIRLLRHRSERGRKAYQFTDHVWMYLDPVSAHRSGRDVVGWEAAGVRPSSTRKRRSVTTPQEVSLFANSSDSG